MRRYKEFGTVIDTSNYGRVQLGLPHAIDMPYSGGLMSARVPLEQEGRPDLIAWEYMNNTQLWEEILVYNGIDDPLGQITVGLELFIPVSGVNTKQIRTVTYRGTE